MQYCSLASLTFGLTFRFLLFLVVFSGVRSLPFYLRRNFAQSLRFQKLFIGHTMSCRSTVWSLRVEKKPNSGCLGGRSVTVARESGFVCTKTELFLARA